MTGDGAAGAVPRRLRFFNGGFLDRHLRRILALAGHELALGWPSPGDGVAVWGRSPYARRGEWVAARSGAALVWIEDAFLRSLRPGRSRGRMGGGTLGLLVDPAGVHFDAGGPSMLENLLATAPLDDHGLLQRARDGIGRLRAADLSKYNLHDPGLPPPAPGYVLVIDQTRGDASVRFSGAAPDVWAQMLAAARDENPGARVVIRAHPETALGLRPGHYGPDDLRPGDILLTDPVSPWALLDGAVAVHAVSSQLGFEAVLAGHRPQIWGHPFYAGWGLTDDRLGPVPRRGRALTRAQVFAAAMILAPLWYDPCRDRLCSFEEAADQLEAEVRAFRQDRHGHVALGMRLWKRPHLQRFFGREKAVVFTGRAERAVALAAARNCPLLVWGEGPPGLAAPRVLRIEDGFLRSRGLGAELVPPLSLVADDLGLYYDPGRESRLERLVRQGPPPGGAERAQRLTARLVALGVTKYNLAGGLPDLPPGHRVLVPGQVEDDASIRLGAGGVRTNLGLLQAARAARPDAVLVYKPHPDVEAGLRPGAVAPADLAGLADAVAHGADPAALIAACDEVFTMTSALGFEALLRGKPVICLGAPFYAGWGLTTDLGPVPARRLRAPDGHPLPRPGLPALVHAALIACPRYRDPVTGRPCPPETALELLATGTIPHPGPWNRLLAKAQGRLASHAHRWR